MSAHPDGGSVLCSVVDVALEILDAADRESFDRATNAVRDVTRKFVDAAREQIRALAVAD
jgi:hypothetical protein